ncbi:hypothetical protein FB451DRAFT_1171710 [Mycena latifolia]|nr:hypothetical protein FB451DRAFT_1171710 [Mycena latifolia]
MYAALDADIINAGYIGAYDASTGSFVGAVAITLGGAGIFTLEKTGNTTNYLSVAAFSNACNDGGPVFLEILSPKDQNAPYVSLTAGVQDCTTAGFMGGHPWAALAAADGFPRTFPGGGDAHVETLL